jgi:hypothetical protein
MSLSELVGSVRKCLLYCFCCSVEPGFADSDSALTTGSRAAAAIHLDDFCRRRPLSSLGPKRKTRASLRSSQEPHD